MTKERLEDQVDQLRARVQKIEDDLRPLLSSEGVSILEDDHRLFVARIRERKGH